MKPITEIRRKVFELTLEQVEERIQSGIWRPGDRLPPLTKLAEELNVGISTLREVLRILESRQIIKIEQGRGMFVRTDLMNSEVSRQLQKKLTPGSLKKLFEARSLLEPEFAAMAAKRAYMDEIRAIGQTAENMATHVQLHESFLDEDMYFHTLIAKAAHNEILFDMFQSMEEPLRESRKQTNLIPGMIEKAVHYHLMIAEAIHDRDAERARKIMKSHMDDASYELNLMDIPADSHSQ